MARNCKRVCEADILVLAGPIWLGDNSSEMNKVVTDFYGNSAELIKKVNLICMERWADASDRE